MKGIKEFIRLGEEEEEGTEKIDLSKVDENVGNQQLGDKGI